MNEGSKESGNTQAPNNDLGPAGIASTSEVRSTKWSTVIAAFSLLVAAGAVGISVYSTHLTEQQNNNAQQQALVSLVTNMAEQPTAPSASASVVSALSEELSVLGEAQEANNIIAGLPHSDVSSVERYIVGVALEDGDDYQPALQLLVSAAREASDPRTTADAWRGAAAVLYTLKSYSQAESDITQAKEAFDVSDVTNVSKENNLAYTDLFDIPYRAVIPDCRTAINEWDGAALIIKEDPGLLSGNNAIAAYRNARTALIDTCKVASGALQGIHIAGAISPQP